MSHQAKQGKNFTLIDSEPHRKCLKKHSNKFLACFLQRDRLCLNGCVIEQLFQPTHTSQQREAIFVDDMCPSVCHSPNLHRHEKCTTYQPKLMSFVSVHKILGADDWHENIFMYLGYFAYMVGIENPFLL